MGQLQMPQLDWLKPNFPLAMQQIRGHAKMWEWTKQNNREHHRCPLRRLIKPQFLVYCKSEFSAILISTPPSYKIRKSFWCVSSHVCELSSMWILTNVGECKPSHSCCLHWGVVSQHLKLQSVETIRRAVSTSLQAGCNTALIFPMSQLSSGIVSLERHRHENHETPKIHKDLITSHNHQIHENHETPKIHNVGHKVLQYCTP